MTKSVWFIVAQNPSNIEDLRVIADDDGNTLTFHSEKAARAAAEKQYLCKVWGCEVYEY